MVALVVVVVVVLVVVVGVVVVVVVVVVVLVALVVVVVVVAVVVLVVVPLVVVVVLVVVQRCLEPGLAGGVKAIACLERLGLLNRRLDPQCLSRSIPGRHRCCTAHALIPAMPSEGLGNFCPNGTSRLAAKQRFVIPLLSVPETVPS